MGWDGMEREAVGCDGMGGCDAMGCDVMRCEGCGMEDDWVRWDATGCDGMVCVAMR